MSFGGLTQARHQGLSLSDGAKNLRNGLIWYHDGPGCTVTFSSWLNRDLQECPLFSTPIRRLLSLREVMVYSHPPPRLS